MIEAWHSQWPEYFDFSQGTDRLEVKSASSRTRAHIFSLEQVHPPSGTNAIVASVHVKEQTNGRTLGELWDGAVDAGPDAKARLKVERVCVEALGEDLGAGREFAADWTQAVESLAFYSVTDIPRPSANTPPGVTQVRFRSDLSIAQRVDPTQVGEFHKCCLGLGTDS